ncbi:hypothetical protein DSO57_1001286 [Entomophthora muscae]|uniref:Uncharacterized protein n=1 Tax=Entomophthora muscae TaxID=34485 RepID=A0ACC2T8T3_9FUNG|nr:hypothetical protein DSO57_1001286 [Entomophthora muscae]
MKTITQVGHEAGCVVGFDLAHAVGNILLELHGWDVDFACWCSYKYLSSGPGNIGGLFVHEKISNNQDFARLTGWWAHRLETRFHMSNVMELSPGAQGFQHSNPSVTNCIALLGSLEIYHEAGMAEFRKKSLLLTGYLEYLILNNATLKEKIKIMTPSQPESRGCQLSLLIDENFEEVFAYLCDNGVICDERRPNCIRVGPYPFVNTFTEMVMFIEYLVEAIQA